MDFHQYTKKSRYEDLENYDTSNFECGDDDNDFVDEKLIIEIKARPCLYDKNTKIQERDKAWSDVAKSLDKSVEFCQYRWRRLKQYFSKERQKRDLCEPSKTSFKFYHKMLFMDAHIYKRKTLRKRQFPKVDNTDKVSIAEVDDTKVRSNDSILASFLEKEVSIKQQSFDVSSDEESSVLVNQCIRNNLITKEMANIELSHSDNNSKDNNSDAVDYSAQSRAGYNFSSRYGNKEHPTFNNISNIKSLTPTVSLNNENKDVQSLQLQTLVQDEFQSILSKLDGIDYKNLNDPKKDEENSVIAKLIVTKLKKIDQNTKTKFKFASWIGSLSAAVSHASAPLVLGTCRRGSTRLTAVIGGLVLALAALFTSFAVQPHQVLLSYGLVLGAGAGLVRETSGLVLGHYFRKRREFVEMIVQAGSGVGIALFSVSYKEAVGQLGWRLGLQTITGVLFTAFFLGLVYRSASLYHPQRHAIVHLKNQQSKLKPKSKSALRAQRQPLIDLGPLASRPVRMLMLAAGTASFGLYTPAFYIALQEYQEENDESASVLLQTCLGLSAALGCAAWGIVTARPSAQCLVSRQYLCQGALVGVAIAQVALGSVQGYHGLVLASGLYGASLGGSLYSLKMLALERLRSRQFAKSWALVQAAEALPILLGVPLTGYMNASSPRVGYYACTLSSLCGAALLFLVGWGRRNPCSPATAASPGGGQAPCACAAAAAAASATMTPVGRTLSRLPKSQSLHIPLNRPEHPAAATATAAHQAAMATAHGTLRGSHLGGFHRSSLYGCTPQHFHEHPMASAGCGGYLPPQGPLRPSKSVPEGLSHQHPHPFHRAHLQQRQPQQQQQQTLDLAQQQQQQQRSLRTPRRCRDVTVIEQITTSV